MRKTLVLIFSALIAVSCGSGTEKYMKFMYESMPLPDRMVHSRDWWEANIEKTLEVRELMGWDVPEREFRHFVLPLRVNNEALDDFRTVYADSLCERVKGLTMAEAALELNHWCHERVTYMPSDARTSSPMATIRAGLGRCGEESVLAVAAMRAAGIPARQVYTPRWAHTDDNHAWVEVYVDGDWHFMGACEPEPALDMAWFNAPVSRAMLLHTKVFGDYHGEEDVISRTSAYTEINVIRGYVPSRRNTVTVTDSQGHPVKGARVEFRIYNYAEFYPVATFLTDSKGQASLDTGLGDIFVWASYGDSWGFTVMGGVEEGTESEADEAAELRAGATAERGARDGAKLETGAKHDTEAAELRAGATAEHDTGATAELKTGAKHDTEATAELKTGAKHDTETAELRAGATAEQGARDGAKLEAEVKLEYKLGQRQSFELHIVPPKEHPLPAEASGEAIAANALRLAAEDAVRAARPHGNQAVLDAFRAAHPGQRALCESIVSSLSIKDLNDVTLEVLEDALAHAGAEFDPYTDCPRIELEALHPYFGEISEGLSAADARELWQWTNTHIRISDATNPQMLRIPPVAVWRQRVADAHSRDIFYVALCRALGFPARIDGITGKVQYREDGVWYDIKTEENAPQGSLALTYGPERPVKSPDYYTHFTLSTVKDGSTQLLTFDETEALSYDALFREPVKLDEGYYLLTTGRRLADGSALTRLDFFNIGRDQTTELPLTLRSAENSIPVLGSFNAEMEYLPESSESECSILSSTGRGWFIMAVVGEPGDEPSNHALRQLEAAAGELNSWGRPVLILRSSSSAALTRRQAVVAGKPEAEMDGQPGLENKAEDKSAGLTDAPVALVSAQGVLASSLSPSSQEELASSLSPRVPSLNAAYYGFDMDAKVAGMLAGAVSAENPRLPIVVVGDSFGRIVYYSQGYNTSIAEDLRNIVGRL